MARAQFGGVLHQVHRLFGAGTVSAMAEAQLLERFITRRDEAAFEALVHRFGPMVLGVCRRLLDDPNDVDDAFQATFLVLVRRAASIRDHDLLGPWLYGVAHRVAARARAQAAKRRATPMGDSDMAAGPDYDPTPDDRGPLLHEEIGRLPEKYRAPIVLCYLEGRTHEDAARLLKWPVGTVKGRLSRARDLLRQRLSRRGLALPAGAGAMAATLARDAHAAVPTALVDSTVRAAMALAAGKAVVAGLASATAVSWAEGVIKTMLSTKLKALAAGLVAFGVIGGGAGLYAVQPSQTGEGGAGVAQQDGAGDGAPPVFKTSRARPDADQVAQKDFRKGVGKASPEDPDPVSLIAKARLEEARRLLDLARRQHEAGALSAGEYLDAQRRYAEALIENSTSEAERIGAMETQVTLLKKTEDTVAQQVKAGSAPQSELTKARFDRLGAELLLAKARQGKPARPPGAEGAARESDNPELAPLLDARLQAARRNVEAQREFYENRLITLDRYIDASSRLANVERDLAKTPADRGAAIEGHLKRMGEIVEGEKAKLEVGTGGSVPNKAEAELAYQEARYLLAQARAGRELVSGEAHEEDADDTAKTEAIRQALNKVVPMKIQQTPLDDVVTYIRESTKSAALPDGIPIYVDPASLAAANGESQPSVSIELQGVRLKTTLRLILNQVGLAYTVKEGLLIITSPNSPELQPEPGPSGTMMQMMGGGLGGGGFGARGGYGGAGMGGRYMGLGGYGGEGPPSGLNAASRKGSAKSKEAAETKQAAPKQ